MVSVFDSVYGEENAKDITYEQFKERYLEAIQLGNKCIKESYAVTLLQRIIKDKNYDEIDTLF